MLTKTLGAMPENRENTYFRIAVGVFFFMSGLCFSSWASRIPNIQQHLQLSEAQLGSILLAMPIGSLISLPFTGLAVDRFGSKKIVLVGTLFYVSILPLIGLADTKWALTIAAMGFGIFGNVLNIAVNTQALAVQQSYGRTIMASFHGLWSVAGFTGASIGALMIKLKVAVPVHFAFSSAVALIMLALAYQHLSEEDKKIKDTTTPSLRPGQIFQNAVQAVLYMVVLAYQQIASRTRGQRNTGPSIFPDKSLLKIGFITFCCMICEGCMFDWSGVYFQKVVMVEKGLVATGYMAFMGTMASGRFISDRLTNRFGTTWMLRASGTLIFSGLMAAVFFPYFSTAIAGFMLVGAGVSSVVPLTYSLAGQSQRMSPGIALAVVSTIGYLGFLLGPPMIGFLAEASSLRASFAFIACMGLMITLITALGKIKTD